MLLAAWGREKESVDNPETSPPNLWPRCLNNKRGIELLKIGQDQEDRIMNFCDGFNWKKAVWHNCQIKMFMHGELFL